MFEIKMDNKTPIGKQSCTKEEGPYLSDFNLSDSFSIFKMSYGVMPWIERRPQACPARFKVLVLILLETGYVRQ
ncbi:hypothetical protein BFS30_24540 [Pedobacter steynii]|uniref:Uncharacterized protein n=1 Tax=Pedobacter steynii TaxID=430522 RepID=A0A1D7QN08_9SPHI|nr:hypothetical protein BFS30_24540 [Pedobacter steynii]